MAQLVTPTSGSVDVPLLIEETNLLALDKVFDDFVEEHMAGGKHEVVRAVVIYLSAGRTVKSERFADAIKQPHVVTEEPLGFRAHLQADRIAASVNLTKLAQNVIQPVSSTQFQVISKSPQLEFNVEPSESPLAQDLFGALQNWAADFAPSTLLRQWYRFKVLTIVLLALWLAMGLIFGFFNVGVSNASYKEQAHKILQEGINESNQRKAIELILAIDSDYPPQAETLLWGSKPGRKYWSFFVSGATVLLALSICPSVVIGIWSGKRKLTRWRNWMKWIFVTVPGAVFLAAVLPRILSILGLKP